MSRNVSLSAPTGLTLYGHTMDLEDVQRWNGSALEAYNVSNWATYKITATEQAQSGIYVLTFPAGAAAGLYRVPFYRQVSDAAGDPLMGAVVVDYDGTDVILHTATVLKNNVTVNALTAAAVTDIFETFALTEAYPTKAATATPAKILYALLQLLSEASVVSTTMTVKKRDGSTSAKTYTLNDATNPTSIVEAT